MNPGDRVRVDRADRTYEGVLLPSSTDDHLVVKLEGGYNVGVDRDDADVELLEEDVYEIDGDIISRPGPRIVDAFEELAAYLYPERFARNDESVFPEDDLRIAA